VYLDGNHQIALGGLMARIWGDGPTGGTVRAGNRGLLLRFNGVEVWRNVEA
jgi:hypothetical protein